MRRALPLLLLVVACSGSTPASRVVFDCQKASFEPSSIQVACGDGGLFLTKLHYTSWASARAVATGVARANECVPNCAQGTFKDFPVDLVFDTPLKRKGYSILSRVVITYTKANPFGDRTETQVLTELEP